MDVVQAELERLQRAGKTQLTPELRRLEQQCLARAASEAGGMRASRALLLRCGGSCSSRAQ